MKTLLHDDFGGLRVGRLKEALDGPYREMHAQPAHPDDNVDNWQRKVGHWSIGTDPWECVETSEGKRLRSTVTVAVYDNVSIAKGDWDWRDVSVSTSVTLQKPGKGLGGPVGVLFRFLDSTRYYAAVIDRDGDAKILKRIVANNWDVLAHAPGKAKIGERFAIEVCVEGPALRANIGGVELRATDAEYAAESSG